MVMTFAYSVILIPAWNWVSTVPRAISKTTSGWFSSNTNRAKSPAGNNQSNSFQTPMPVIVSATKTPKLADCEKIIKQIKAGKYIALPPECEQTYQAVKQQEQIKLEEQKQKEEARRRDEDRAGQERENQQRLELERQRDIDRQSELARQRQEAEQLRAANAERERQRQEAEDRRRQEVRDESARREARQAAEERERTRQREQQKRNEAIIKFGTDLKKIFRKNN